MLRIYDEDLLRSPARTMAHILRFVGRTPTSVAFVPLRDNVIELGARRIIAGTASLPHRPIWLKLEEW